MPSGDHTDCWHQKHLGRFRDNCLTCDRPCQAFPVKERPYFAPLLELEREAFLHLCGQT